MSFINELKRRNIFKVAVVYAIVAWLLIQIVATVLPTFNAPQWISQTIIFVLILGFPVVMVIAWAFELTPEGIKPTKDVAEEHSVSKQTGQKLNRLLITSLALALVLIVFDAYILTKDDSDNTQADLLSESAAVMTNNLESSSETTAGSSNDINDVPTKSIAVLPFVNLSDDESQEYFADGLSEELLNRLAQIRDLQVAGRTSSFYYKGLNEDLRVIGETLGVAHILEGSVRKSGNQIRITAQLIEAENGFHLWSETYDRELTEIFAIQDEISQAVTTALSVTLRAGEFNRLGMTNDIEAYELFLKAQTLGFNGAGSLDSIDLYHQALALDPDFALAWTQLGITYDDASAVLLFEETQGFPALAKEAFDHASDLAPDMLESRLFTANTIRTQENWLVADEDFSQLIEDYGQSNARVNYEYATFLRATGRFQEELPYLERAVRLDPLNSEYNLFLAYHYLYQERYEEADVLAEFGLTLANNWQEYFLDIKLRVAFYKGDYDKAKAIADQPGMVFEALIEAFENNNLEPLLFGFQSVLDNASQLPLTFKSGLSTFASMIDENEIALVLSLGPNERLDFINPHLWSDILGPMRELLRFKELVEEAGLANYWRTTGNWPDKCRPMTDSDDFECF